MKLHATWVLGSWLALSAIPAVAQAAQGDPPTGDPEISAYFFIGADLLAIVDEQPYPAIRVDRKYIYFKPGDKIEKIRLDDPIGMRLKPRLTKDFLKVGAPDLSFENTRVARAELRMLSELSYSQAASDDEIADLRRANPVTPDEELISQEQNFRELMENRIDEERMREDQQVDTVNIRFTLNPSEDFADVYVVCGISYDLPSSTSEEPERGSRMAVRHLGDLSKGIDKPFQLRARVASFPPDKVKCELFFFKGEAEPIAHSFSRKLRGLTEEEAAQVTELIN